MIAFLLCLFPANAQSGGRQWESAYRKVSQRLKEAGPDVCNRKLYTVFAIDNSGGFKNNDNLNQYELIHSQLLKNFYRYGKEGDRFSLITFDRDVHGPYVARSQLSYEGLKGWFDKQAFQRTKVPDGTNLLGAKQSALREAMKQATQNPGYAVMVVVVTDRNMDDKVGGTQSEKNNAALARLMPNFQGIYNDDTTKGILSQETIPLRDNANDQNTLVILTAYLQPALDKSDKVAGISRKESPDTLSLNAPPTIPLEEPKDGSGKYVAFGLLLLCAPLALFLLKVTVRLEPPGNFGGSEVRSVSAFNPIHFFAQQFTGTPRNQEVPLPLINASPVAVRIAILENLWNPQGATLRTVGSGFLREANGASTNQIILSHGATKELYLGYNDNDCKYLRLTLRPYWESNLVPVMLTTIGVALALILFIVAGNARSQYKAAAVQYEQERLRNENQKNIPAEAKDYCS